MKLNPNEVYTFKLTSGEEVVAKFIKQGDSVYTITNPLSVAMAQEGMQLIASVFTAKPDRQMELLRNSVSMIAETRQELENSYIEATTGVRPVQKQIITG